MSKDESQGMGNMSLVLRNNLKVTGLKKEEEKRSKVGLSGYDRPSLTLGWIGITWIYFILPSQPHFLGYRCYTVSSSELLRLLIHPWMLSLASCKKIIWKYVIKNFLGIPSKWVHEENYNIQNYAWLDVIQFELLISNFLYKTI